MRTHLILAAVTVLAGSALAAPPRSEAEGPLSPEELAKMDLGEMQTLAEFYLQEMNQLVTDVLEGLSEAQKGNDLPRVQCISGVLSSLKGLVRLSEQNRISLREAAIANDRATAAHEFVKLHVARNRVRELHAQAKGCGGPGVELVFEGTPQVDRKEEGDLPMYSTNVGLDIPAIVPQRVPSVSPFY